MNIRSLMVVLLCVFGVTIPTACKRSTADINADDAGFSVVHTDDGKEVQVRLGAGPVPAEFPAGMPFYPGVLRSSTSRVSGDVVMVMSTPDTEDAVLAFYRKQAAFADFREATVGPNRVLSMTHTASQKEVQVVCKKINSGTQVSLVTKLAPSVSP